MRKLLVFELMVLFLSRQVGARNGTSRSRQSFVIRYKQGDEIIPVTVTLDFSRQTAYVVNMAPRAAEKSMTFYDFKQRVITYKDLKTKHCFLARMIHETLDNERGILETMQNRVIPDQAALVLSASEGSLSPTAVKNLAGERAAIFCRGMTTTLVSTQPHSLRRSKRQTGQYVHRSYNHYGQQTNTYSQYGHETYVVNGHRGDGDIRDHLASPNQVATGRSSLPSRKNDVKKPLLRNGPLQPPARLIPHQWPPEPPRRQMAPVHGIQSSLHPTQRTIIRPPPFTPPPPPPPHQMLPAVPGQAVVRGRLQMEASKLPPHKYTSPSQVSAAQKNTFRQPDRGDYLSLPAQDPISQGPGVASGTLPLYLQNLYQPGGHLKNEVAQRPSPKSDAGVPFRSKYSASLEGHVPSGERKGTSAFSARIEPLPADVDYSKHFYHEGRSHNYPSEHREHDLSTHYRRPATMVPEESRHHSEVRKDPASSEPFSAVQYSPSPEDNLALLNNHPVIPHDIHVEVIPAINASSPLWTFSRGIYSPSLSNISDILEQYGPSPSSLVAGGGSVTSDRQGVPKEERLPIGGKAMGEKPFDPPAHLIYSPNTVASLHKLSETAPLPKTTLLPHYFKPSALLPEENIKNNEVISSRYSPTDALLEKTMEGSSAVRVIPDKYGSSSSNLTLPARIPSATDSVWRVPSEEISQETVVFYPGKQLEPSARNNEVPPSTVVRGAVPPLAERVKHHRKSGEFGKIRRVPGRQQHRLPQVNLLYGRNVTSLRSRSGKSVSFIRMQNSTFRDSAAGLGGLVSRPNAVVERRFKTSPGRRHYSHRLKSQVPGALPPGVSVHPRHPSAPYSEMVTLQTKQTWLTQTARDARDKAANGLPVSKTSARRRSGSRRPSCCHRKLQLARPTAAGPAAIRLQIERSSRFPSCCEKGRRRHRNIQHSVVPCCQGKAAALQDESSPQHSLSPNEGQTSKSCPVDQTCSIVYRTVGQVKICRVTAC